MKFSDIGIILFVEKKQEDLLLLKILSKRNGLCSGIAKKPSKKTLNNYQIANLVQFDRYARLENQLGTIKCENKKSFQGKIIFDKFRIYAFRNLTNLILYSFLEYEPHVPSYEKFLEFLENIDSFSWLNYFLLELKILEDAGYGLQIERCAVTGSAENLQFISPKSGKAVSLDSAKGYENLLLKLPYFIHHKIEPQNYDEISDAFSLTEYFFVRYAWKTRNIENLIKERENFKKLSMSQTLT